MDFLGVPLSTPDAKRLRQFLLQLIVVIAICAMLDRSDVMADGEAATFLASTTGCLLALAYGVSPSHGLRGFFVMWLFGIPMMALTDALRALL